MHVSRLDDIACDIKIKAEKLADKGNVLYHFTVMAANCVLLEGRAALLLGVNKPAAEPFLQSPLTTLE
ncbi:3-hydroxylacyl-ACP dehydratase [Acidithiobacillus thiooxidans ATCC 19377]|uniref:3-hydroxylacyl-ACP dehydratase n=1 Tax=Acidithiobacillus thiooxidans ATCC 19377 TaxID=637390 RepID=A0A5P9XMF0_ACITH|nr:3-hydroxylacyl-ACP dehydratase [Acidithiobacillus thiooxidans ATCC 19377]